MDEGCGSGVIIHNLQESGFQSKDVDFASAAANINLYAPELIVTVEDVCQSKFPDGFFDGYWSLGVIEQFL